MGKSLTMANEVLQARLAGLKKMESSEFLGKEIADLTELIKEVEEKVADFEEMKAQVTKKMKGLNKDDGNPSAEEKPAAAIAVKRKNKIIQMSTLYTLYAESTIYTEFN